MFLTIQNKQDSAEKLAAVAGKPTENYLFAPEFNTVVNSINTLRNLISLNSGNIDYLLSTSPKLELGIISGSFVTAINELEEVNLAAPIFITYFTAGIFYVKAFVGIDGTYGTTPENYVAEGDFLPLYQSDSLEATSPSIQDNIPKKATYTFAELELDPATATHEEIIAAVKIKHAGAVVTDVELRYIEIIEGLISYNFDVSYLVDVEINESQFIDYLVGTGWSPPEITFNISDFNISGKRLRCNIQDLVGSPLQLFVGGFETIHNLTVLADYLEISPSTGSIENITFIEGNKGFIISGPIGRSNFDFPLPSTMESIRLINSDITLFTPSGTFENVTEFDLRNNQIDEGGYNSMYEWALLLPFYSSGCTMDFTGNPSSPMELPIRSVIESKNITLIYE
jgi:hypothetical protein